MKVVLVEDSLLIATHLLEQLHKLRQVSLAAHAVDENAAITLIEQMGADLVILDIGLQQGSGLGVLNRLRKTRPGPVVFVLSNHTHPEMRKACHQAGAQQFFDKHTQSDACIRAVEQLANQRQHTQGPLEDAVCRSSPSVG